jgi:hypothetical protein
MGPSSWSAIAQRILGLPADTTQDSPVNLYLTPGGTVHHVSSTNALDRLCLAARLMGEGQLGFHDKEIGTHSIRSGAAMAMYLSGVPAIVIMLIGRWSSDGFLLYIRRQVQEFSYGISSFPTNSSPSPPHNPMTPAPGVHSITSLAGDPPLAYPSRAMQTYLHSLFTTDSFSGLLHIHGCAALAASPRDSVPRVLLLALVLQATYIPTRSS